jgi:hypothetical protein
MITISISKQEKKEIDLINKIIQKIETEEIDVNKILNLIKKEFKIFDKTEQKELLTRVIQLIMIIKKEV